MDWMKTSYIVTIVFGLMMTTARAQTVCQEQLVVNGSAIGSSLGQSIFMQGCEGFFSSIALNRSDDGGALVANLTIFTGQTFIGVPRYTQIVTIPAGAGEFTIALGSGVGDLSFFEDSQYTFMLSNAALALEASGDIDSYGNGQLFVDVGFINSDDLWFQLTTTSTLDVASYEAEDVTLYPNPARGFISLSGLDTAEPFEIYTSLGVKVSDGWVRRDERLAVEHLNTGLYYLKLNGGQTMRFVKD